MEVSLLHRFRITFAATPITPVTSYRTKQSILWVAPYSEQRHIKLTWKEGAKHLILVLETLELHFPYKRTKPHRTHLGPDPKLIKNNGDSC